MKSKRLVLKIITAFLMVLAFIAMTSQPVAVAESFPTKPSSGTSTDYHPVETTDKATQGEGQSGGNNETARNCVGTCNGIINSRDTGWTSVVVPASGYIDYPGYDYGPIHIPATRMTFDAPPGTTIYLYGVFAGRGGSLSSTNGRVPVSKGQFLAPISVAGLAKADGTWMKEFAAAYYAKQVYGTSYRKNARGLDEQSLLAKYKQLLTTGALTIDDLLNPLFNYFGDFDGLVEALGEEEVKKILIELPPPSIPPVPLMSCHIGTHAGWAEGKAQVQNMTTGTGWTEEVWARPGDTVQFMIQYCWGVGAVGGTVGNSSSPYAIYPGANARVFGKSVDEVWFSLSATQNEKYLFGENEQVISGGTNDLKRILSNPHQQTIGATGVGFSDSNVDKTGDYAFTVLSPGQKDGGKYACTIYDFTPYYTSPGYQIPGIAEGSCPAIANNGGIMSDVSNSYGIISQTIKYNKATAWQMWRHNHTGQCLGCTQDPPGWVKPIPSKPIPGAIPGYNTLEEYNANVRSNPFQTMDAAIGAGVNNWGLIVKHEGDTANHQRDCDDVRCGCAGWHTLCSASGHKCCGHCEKYAPTYECADGSGTCGGGCEEYKYDDCYQGCNYSGTSIDGPCECMGKSGPNYIMPTYDYSTGMKDEGEQSSTAKVNVPYNYYTSTKSGINEDDRIYLGEGVTSNFVVSILPRSNTSVHNGEPYATLHDGRIQAVEFIVSADDNIDAVGGSENTPQDPCAYYQNNLRVISGCNTIWSVDPMLNPQGRYGGWTYTQVVDRVVPDNPDAFSEDLVGARYCVAVGISHSDSHGQPGGGTVSGMSNPSDWRISGASCRTIAKKPNFQVWNGYMYTNGSIITSQTRKHVNANLGDSADPTGLFGSWDEYHVIAAKEVTGFASGAGLGYYGKERNTSLGLQGGNNPNTDQCDLSKMTIANESCLNSDVGSTGYSNMRKNMDAVIERLYSRYTNPSSTNGVSVLANGATYVNYNGDLSTSQIKNLSGANSALLINTEFGPSYIRQTKSSVNSDSEQTTSNYASNTLVIYTTGKLTIDTNICTGSGDCSYGNNGASLTLQGRNNDWYNNIYSIPQVLIIAKKGIDVKENVNQIDAWMVTDGTVNTCTEFSVGSGSSEQCTNPLIVNGPVVAKSLLLNRTAGANPGSGIADTSNVLYKNLANDGSITPGEIFNLRPDTLYWAYGQSQRFSQANVTYTRELAPRY